MTTTDPEAPVIASATYRVERMGYGAMSGHWGSFSTKRIDIEQDYWSDPRVEDIVGRNLADGTVIKVTVEIVQEKPWPPKPSFWHDGKHHTHGHYGVDSTKHSFGTFKAGDPWGCIECHLAAGCCDGVSRKSS